MNRLNFVVISNGFSSRHMPTHVLLSSRPCLNKISIWQSEDPSSRKQLFVWRKGDRGFNEIRAAQNTLPITLT